MPRLFFIAAAVLVTAGCNLEQQSAAIAVLDKIAAIRDAGTLDYAAARKLFGVPLSTSGHFKAIASGDRITYRSGEYRGGDTPEFSGTRLDMEWRAEPVVHKEGWRTEKGLRSFLSAGFDPNKVCITKSLLDAKWGRAGRGGMADSPDVTLSYGDVGKPVVSFTFGQSVGYFFDFSECARDVTIVVNNSAAGWVTPTDASAGDAEFFFRLSPLDTSGKSLMALGFECGFAGAASSKPGDVGCVCPRGHQTPAGPCRHAVTFIPYREGDRDLKQGDFKIEVLPLHLPDMN